MLTCGIVLLITSTVYVTHDIITLKKSIAEKLLVITKVIGSNSTAALSFDDEDAAEEILASFSTEHCILSAYLYKKDGSVFSKYLCSGQDWDSLTHRMTSDISLGGDKFKDIQFEHVEELNGVLAINQNISAIKLNTDTSPLRTMNMVSHNPISKKVRNVSNLSIKKRTLLLGQP